MMHYEEHIILKKPSRSFEKHGGVLKYVADIVLYVGNIVLYVVNIQLYVTNIELYVANIELYIGDILRRAGINVCPLSIN
jgi:hypothetical protein